MSPITIVSLHSRKGGVGKSTLSLWIASELARGHDTLLIDADVVGTEIADLFSDDPGGPDMWPLGLMDLLTQSTGGNASFESFLGQAWPKRRRELPQVKLNSNAFAVLPSSRFRDPRRRERVRSELAQRFMVLDFAKEQVRRRFFTLLRHLSMAKSSTKPAAIVIDNSPFHVGLAELIAGLPIEPAPIGLAQEHRDFFGGQARFHHLEVVGPDPQDLAIGWSDEFPGHGNPQDRPHYHKGLILNRDEHLTAHETVICPSLEMVDDETQERCRTASKKVLHVGFSGPLGRGCRSLYGQAKEGVWPPVNTYQSMLVANWSQTQRLRFDTSTNRYEPLDDWSDFLEGLG